MTQRGKLVCHQQCWNNETRFCDYLYDTWSLVGTSLRNNVATFGRKVAWAPEGPHPSGAQNILLGGLSEAPQKLALAPFWGGHPPKKKGPKSNSSIGTRDAFFRCWRQLRCGNIWGPWRKLEPEDVPSQACFRGASQRPPESLLTLFLFGGLREKPLTIISNTFTFIWFWFLAPLGSMSVRCNLIYFVFRNTKNWNCWTARCRSSTTL